MADPIRDFKYRQLLFGKIEWEEVLSRIAAVKSDCLKECADAFALNLSRTGAFGAMPVQIAHMVRRDQIFFDNAIFKITGKGDIKLSDFSGEPSFEVKAEANRQMVEYRSKPEIERTALAFTMGINYVETLIAAHPTMRDAADAIFASIVSNSWTAFESLASDLWVAGVDNGPQEISGRLALSNQLQKGEENITHKTLHSVESDFRTQHGSWLREVGKVSFQRLDHIKLYYGIAFEDRCRNLFDDTAGGYIVALAAIRNALTHKSGIADKKFVKDAQRFTELNAIKVGEPILLDGEFVQKLRIAAAELGAELIAHVDKLITPQAAKS